MKKLFKRNYLFSLLPIALSILSSLNYFWSKPLVPGFDAPFYLTEIKNFSVSFPNPLTYRYLDRYLTMAFPGVLTRIIGLDPVNSYRIAITIVYVAIAISLYFLFRNITKNNSLAMVLSSAIVISPFLLNYTLLFANFTAFLILFSFFAVETGKDFKYKEIVLGLIFGSIFYVHNFSTVSFGLIIGTYYLLKLVVTKDLKIIKSAFIIFLISSIVGFIGIARYLGIDLTSGTGANSITPAEPLAIGNESKIIIDAFDTYTGKFWFYYFSASVLVMAIMLRKDLLRNQKKFILPLSILLPSLILTFQPLYQMNFLPDRFATLVGLSSYFIYVAFITFPSLKKYVAVLAVAPLLFNYLASDSLILNKGYRSFSNQEIGVYKKINNIVPKGSTIITSSAHAYWGQYFLEGRKVQTAEYFVSCGKITERGYLNEINFTTAKLLAEKNGEIASVLLNNLKNIIPDKPFYIMVDTGLSCGDGKILNQLANGSIVFYEDNWYLYEID
jgi:hypothetical protein